jgi:mono/diheme cytochrome c family protein
MSRDYQSAARVAVRLALGSLALTVGAIVMSPATVRAQTSDEWVAPERRARRPNPVPQSAEVVAQGRESYRKECQSCHGTSGRGDGPKAGELEKKPGDLTSARVQGQSDGALFWKITEGRGDMPNTRTTLTDEQRWMVIHYVRTLAKKIGSRASASVTTDSGGMHAYVH